MLRVDRLIVAAALSLSSLLPACKNNETTAQPPPQPAPRIAPPPVATQAKKVGRATRATNKADDWRNTRLDATPSRSKRARGTAKGASTAKQDAGATSSDADVAAYKAAKARSSDEKALDVKLRAAMTPLGDCLRGSGDSAKSAEVQIRVHRSGYVMGVSASGVTGAVQRCFEGALTNVRVGTLESGKSLTIKRTFKLIKRAATTGSTTGP